MPNNTTLIPRRTIQHQKKTLKYLDFEECSKMAEWGFSCSLMSRTTGLSQSAVYYRLRQMKIHIRDFRNGQSETAKYALDLMNEKYYLDNLKERLQNKMRELELIRIKNRAEKLIKHRKIAA